MIKDSERGNLYIKFILSKNIKNKDELFHNNDSTTIILSIKKSINEYSFIMNDENSDK